MLRCARETNQQQIKFRVVRVGAWDYMRQLEFCARGVFPDGIDRTP
jgi:hypothetical protein